MCTNSARSRGAVGGDAVNAMIGKAAVRGSALSCRTVSIVELPGITMSTSISDGTVVDRISYAWLVLSASSTP